MQRQYTCKNCGKLFLSRDHKVHLFCERACYLDYQMREVDRFWDKVDTSGGNDSCWLWMGGGRPYGKSHLHHKTMDAHRVSWELAHGPIPEGLDVLHSCDTPRCVNPAHLFLGTQADNGADMKAKGRQARGTRVMIAKLNPQIASDIRREYADGLLDQRQLGRKYHTSQSNIGRILHFEIWKE